MKNDKNLTYTVAVTVMVALLMSCSHPVDHAKGKSRQSVQPIEVHVNDSYWSSIADTAQSALVKHYWSSDGQYFIEDHSGNTSFNYWWQAHALDVLCDGFYRTQDHDYIHLMSKLHEGIQIKNGGTFINDFYDDMEWLALACLRAYDLSNDVKYKNTAEILWADIKTGWNEAMGGGICWRKSQTGYKNTPANAPACILAARLFQINQNPEDLEWAVKINNWLKQNLVDPETGIVWDGINRKGDGKIDKDWKFTYCQGVFIGAGLALFKVTNERSYLDDAIRTANYVVSDPYFSPDRILRGEGSGDGGLFKGILVRYLIQLIKEGNLDQTTQAKYVNFLKKNGESLWNKATKKPAVLFGTSWSELPVGSTDCSTQLSGIMLLEGVAKLEDLHLLD